MKLAIFTAIIVAILAFPAHAPVEAQSGTIVLTDSADVTGAGAVVHAATSGVARVVDAFAITGNSAVIRCGGTNVSATVGKPIAAGGAYHWQAMPQDSRLSTSQALYSLASISCYVASGDKVNFSWSN